MVLRGHAEPGLLETYETERVPVGKQIVARSNQSVREFKLIFEALGLDESLEPEQMQANMRQLKEATSEGAIRREQLRQAIAFKAYEFATQGVELNVRYRSKAVAEESGEPTWSRDPELYYDPTTFPGGRLPHVWLIQDGRQISSLDLVGQASFTLLTGIGGEVWIDAADNLRKRFGLPLQAHVIGPGRKVQDLYGDWANIRGIPETGGILIRPDGYVAWRSYSSEDASTKLAEILGRILGRALGGKESVTVPSLVV